MKQAFIYFVLEWILKWCSLTRTYLLQICWGLLWQWDCVRQTCKIIFDIKVNTCTIEGLQIRFYGSISNFPNLHPSLKKPLCFPFWPPFCDNAINELTVNVNRYNFMHNDYIFACQLWFYAPECNQIKNTIPLLFLIKNTSFSNLICYKYIKNLSFFPLSSFFI